MENNLENLSEDVLKEHLELAERLEELEKVEKAQKNFLSFVRTQWPSFIEGAHHKVMAEAFDRIADGKFSWS